jgi:hypothetical protein
MRRGAPAGWGTAARPMLRALAGLTGVAMLALACATVERFEAAQAGWVGQPIDDYLADTGLAPAEVIAADDGALYVFSFARRYQSPGRTPETSPTIDRPGSFPANPYPHASVPIEQRCAWMYRTDAAGIIQGFEYEGDACRQ